MDIPIRRILLPLFLFLLTTLALSAQSFITYTEGDVNVKRGPRLLAGDIGLELKKGDRIETGTDSLAVLELEGRGTVKLRSDTSLLLSNLGDSMEVFLMTGGLFSRIRKLAGREYGVRAPNVVAAVRGTEFFVAYGRQIEESPDLWLCVNEGTVEVALQSSGDSVMVEEGQGINILSGRQITDPQFYPWTENLNWNTNPDAGAVGDETDLDGAYTDLRVFDYD